MDINTLFNCKQEKYLVKVSSGNPNFSQKLTFQPNQIKKKIFVEFAVKSKSTKQLIRELKLILS